MLNKIAKNTVAIISIIILAVFTIMSLFYVTTVKNFNENVFINLTTSIGLLIYLVIDVVLVLLLKIINTKIKKNRKTKIIKIGLVAACMIVYMGVSINWIHQSKVEPVDDSKSVNNLAISFANRRLGRN